MRSEEGCAACVQAGQCTPGGRSPGQDTCVQAGWGGGRGEGGSGSEGGGACTTPAHVWGWAVAVGGEGACVCTVVGGVMWWCVAMHVGGSTHHSMLLTGDIGHKASNDTGALHCSANRMLEGAWGVGRGLWGDARPAC